MIFQFQEFAKYAHKSFQDFTLDEVIDLLELEDDGYNKSDPQSSQKRLTLERILISGIKSNGNKFLYDKPLFSGVSLWVADNFKGKSTIFKAVRFALTGRENFTPQIKTWIKRIALQFSINDIIYTVSLDLSGGQLRSSVHNCSMENTEGLEPLKLLTGKDGLAEFMQNLFFEAFGYYPIKRVQATQTAVKLSDADLTWVTYYSAIYQQSKDYGNLDIGSQHAMVFQMLLGLQYTYSIHALDVKARVAEREWDLKSQQEKVGSKNPEEIHALKNDLSRIKTSLDTLTQHNDKEEITKAEVILDDLNTALEKERKDLLDVNTQLFDLKTLIGNDEAMQHHLQDQILSFQREINKLSRLANEYQEYIDSGILFSNLSVTECPHCNHEVSDTKRKVEKDSKICMLCDHQLEPSESDAEIWKNRIAESKADKTRYDSQLIQDSTKLDEVIERIRLRGSKLTEYNSVALKSNERLNLLTGQIKTAYENLAQMKSKLRYNYFEKYEELLKEKIKLEYEIQLGESKDGNTADVKLKRKAELLRYGHSLLLRRRAEKGGEILNNLEEIMLRQLHSLGLNSYTKVVVNPTNFMINYFQDAVSSGFNEISEGEQLRAKLALYLSLIELDFSKGLGRHPRLLILDSPTKEEGDHHFVQGLKNTLSHIEQEFGEKVQVLVGTANRDLLGVITDPKKLEVHAIDEFVF